MRPSQTEAIAILVFGVIAIAATGVSLNLSAEPDEASRGAELSLPASPALRPDATFDEAINALAIGAFDRGYRCGFGGIEYAKCRTWLDDSMKKEGEKK